MLYGDLLLEVVFIVLAHFVDNLVDFLITHLLNIDSRVEFLKFN